MPARLNRDTTGPLARTVADAARLFEAMVGYDPKDNLTSLLLQVHSVLPDLKLSLGGKLTCDKPAAPHRAGF